MRNTNSTIAESLERVKQIQEVCAGNDKKLVIYISMGFGNPYGDQWNVEIVQQWVDHLSAMDIKIMALSDTIGVATPESIEYLFGNLIPPYPDVEFGAHLHTQPHNWYGRIDAAYKSGCRRFDSAIKGFGGCPMAKDDLTGNMATENLISYFDKNKLSLGIDKEAFTESMRIALEIFP
jgi:hydroxymethylglutaryl-CoA lyase